MKYFLFLFTLSIVAASCGAQEVELQEAISMDLGGWKLDNIVSQSVSKRVWREIVIEETALAGSSDSLVLYRPGAVFGDANGFSFVVDYGDMRIKKFDSSGRLVGIFGNGQGDGPGEMQNPVGVQVLEGGLIAILDPRPRRLNHFKADGSFAFSLALEQSPWRFAQTKSGLTYFMARPLQITSLFSAFRDTTVSRFPHLYDDPLPTMGHLDGQIIAVEEDMIYMPYHYGVFIRYDELGEQVYARETIGGRDFGEPTIEKVETPGWPANYLVTERSYINRGITSDDENLFVHGRIAADSLREASVIDVYRALDGEYQYSLSAPHRAWVSKMYGSYVYSLMDTTVVISKVHVK